ncbi:MAG: hypothetical protein JWN44_2314 [Myxococcales bacterium]|nr:hypothetical protein [Myxococcales bacterium]
MSMPSDPIDQAVRDAAPRAPHRFADGVERRLAAQRRGRGRIAAVGALIALAAGLVLWLVARTPSAPVIDSSWTAVAARDTTLRMTTAHADAAPLAPGRVLPVGALITVARGGEARLERTTALGTVRARLGEESETRVGDGALELLSGGVRLEGPEARLTGDVAAVEALGVSADVAVELRRNPMWNLIPKAAALSALLAVTVHDGGAKVEAKGHDPILLAKSDRALVAPKLPPLVTRANAANAAAAKKAQPAPATAKKPATSAGPPAPEKAAIEGGLDKDTVRRVIRDTLGDLRACYDAALEDNEHLAGRIVVEMKVVTENGKGRVKEGEIVPNDSGDLDAPKMQQCILEALSRAEFPPSVDGQPVIIRYPFAFANHAE